MQPIEHEPPRWGAARQSQRIRHDRYYSLLPQRTCSPRVRTASSPEIRWSQGGRGVM